MILEVSSSLLLCIAEKSRKYKAHVKCNLGGGLVGVFFSPQF